LGVNVASSLFISLAKYGHLISIMPVSDSKVFPDRDFQRKMFDKLCEFYKLHAIPYFQNINNVPASSV
jgi:hypothetical protein